MEEVQLTVIDSKVRKRSHVYFFIFVLLATNAAFFLVLSAKAIEREVAEYSNAGLIGQIES